MKDRGQESEGQGARKSRTGSKKVKDRVQESEGQGARE